MSFVLTDMERISESAVKRVECFHSKFIFDVALMPVARRSQNGFASWRKRKEGELGRKREALSAGGFSHRFLCDSRRLLWFYRHDLLIDVFFDVSEQFFRFLVIASFAEIIQVRQLFADRRE